MSNIWETYGQEFCPENLDHIGQPGTLRNATHKPTDIAVGERYYERGVFVDSSTGVTTAKIDSTVPAIGKVADEISYSGVFPIPQDMDTRKPVRVFVVWSCVDGTPAQSVEWLVKYDASTPESGVIVTPATALDTVIVTDAENDTPNTLQVTAPGVIDADTLNVDDFWNFSVECEAEGSVSDPAAHFHGLWILYSRKAL